MELQRNERPQSVYSFVQPLESCRGVSFLDLKPGALKIVIRTGRRIYFERLGIIRNRAPTFTQPGQQLCASNESIKIPGMARQILIQFSPGFGVPSGFKEQFA